ncbi:MAG: DUF4166 domain-containing protein [Phenylobacterium sp.]
MNRRIVLVGATGAFGRRLARRLAAWPDITLVLAARRLPELDALADQLRRDGAAAILEVAAFDRDAPAGLADLRPWAVADAAGPFQGGDFRLVRAAIAAGAHYVDIADARDFVNRFPELDAEARAAGVLAVTGASSTPALSNAALDAITSGLGRIDAVTVAISPGARAPRGLSVVKAILSYVGRPVRVWRAGTWRMEAGWGGLKRIDFPGLGRRWTALCETPDLDILAGRAGREANFRAGLELAPMHLGLWLLSWLVRLGLARSLTPLARPLRALAGVFAPFGSDRGGMVVAADGAAPDGERRRAQWGLWAEAGAGPTVPVAAAAAVLRGLTTGAIATRGAQACVGLVGLDAILRELSGLPIETCAHQAAPDDPVLLRRVLGAGADQLAPAVIAVHLRAAAASLQGGGRARGHGGLVARTLRNVMGMPHPGSYPDIAVIIEPDRAGETWSRRFGARRFRSRLASGAEPGHFEERFGPLRFVFRAELKGGGFRWRFVRWSLGPLPLPAGLSPRIRAVSFARDGVYRFRAITAHPWLGLLFAYSGCLRPPPGA